MNFHHSHIEAVYIQTCLGTFVVRWCVWCNNDIRRKRFSLLCQSILWRRPSWSLGKGKWAKSVNGLKPAVYTYSLHMWHTLIFGDKSLESELKVFYLTKLILKVKRRYRLYKRLLFCMRWHRHYKTKGSTRPNVKSFCHVEIFLRQPYYILP